VISICDTGPLVAYLNRRDPHHRWAVLLMSQVNAPLLTCDAVLTEAAYFLREDDLPVDPLFEMLERGALRLDFRSRIALAPDQDLDGALPADGPRRRVYRGDERGARALPGAHR
jgi:predicted nucleic acid-binding protein